MPAVIAHLKNPRFRFREKELALILDSWKNDESVLLTGIRRTGKSELAKAALVRHADAGGQIGFLNVADYVSLHDFYRDLLREMPKSLVSELGKALKSAGTVPDKLLTWIRSHFSKAEVLGQGVEFKTAEVLPRYWQPIVDALEQVISRHPSGELPVLGIDELPFMLENLIRAGVSDGELTVALASLRKLRDAGLRMVIAGSISMENLLTLHGIPHTVLGGLARVPVPPFSREEARLFLEERLLGTPACTEAVITLTLETLPDYVPEFLKIAGQNLRVIRDPSICAASLHADVLPAIRRAFLEQFEERLNKNYPGDHLVIAEQVLDIIARADPDGSLLDGSALPSGHRRVVQLLQYDNFIAPGSDFRWQFSLNLLRQWWRATRGIV